MDISSLQTIIELTEAIDTAFKTTPTITASIVCSITLLLSIVYGDTKKGGYLFGVTVVAFIFAMTNSYFDTRRLTAESEPVIAQACEEVLVDISSGKVKWLHEKGIDAISNNCGGWIALQNAANSPTSQLALLTK